MGKLSSTNERKYLLLALRKTVDLLRGFLSEEYVRSGIVFVRGCLHDTGTSFILARVHPGSYLSLCICLHYTDEKSHTSTTHTGISSSRWLYWIEILITV